MMCVELSIQPRQDPRWLLSSMYVCVWKPFELENFKNKQCADNYSPMVVCSASLFTMYTELQNELP